ARRGDVVSPMREGNLVGTRPTERVPVSSRRTLRARGQTNRDDGGQDRFDLLHHGAILLTTRPRGVCPSTHRAPVRRPGPKPTTSGLPPGSPKRLACREA